MTRSLGDLLPSYYLLDKYMLKKSSRCFFEYKFSSKLRDNSSAESNIFLSSEEDLDIKLKLIALEIKYHLNLSISLTGNYIN